MFRISSFNDGHWDEAKCRIEMSEIIDKFQERQRCKGLAGLIVFNSRKSSYSMEKLYTSFASLYGLTIWADDESRVLIEGLEMEDGNVTHLIASKPEEAAIHILSGNKCQKEVSGIVIGFIAFQLPSHINFIRSVSQNLLEYLSHMNAYHMIVFQVCADDSPHVSLQRPAYDVFPLKIYSEYTFLFSSVAYSQLPFLLCTYLKRSFDYFSYRYSKRIHSASKWVSAIHPVCQIKIIFGYGGLILPRFHRTYGFVNDLLILYTLDGIVLLFWRTWFKIFHVRRTSTIYQ